MSLGPHRRLSCGADPDILVEHIAEGTPIPEQSHQASCPACQAAMVELKTVWTPVLKWAAEPLRAPAWLSGAVMTRVRAIATSPAVLVERTSRGTTEVTEWALALVVAMAARATPGLVPAGEPARQGDRRPYRLGGSQSVEVAARSVMIAWDGAAIRVALSIAVEMGYAVDEVAGALRHHVTLDLRRLAGIEASAVDIEVIDVMPMEAV